MLIPVGAVCGALIFGAMFVLGACLTFWTVGSGEMTNAFTYGGNTMTSYPLNIFGPWLRRTLAFVIPLAFVDVLPRPLPARQARPARVPARLPAARSRRRARVRDDRRVRVALLRPALPEHGLVIRVDGVSKTFTVWRRAGPHAARPSVVHAVDDVSFSVDAGEMVGYVGPNGAGKTTTIKMLTGVLVPSDGDVEVSGLVPHRDRVTLARRIGVVFGQRSLLWWDLPLADSFDLLRHIYRVDATQHRARLDECIELLQLGEFLHTPVRQLSLGQRMRGELTAALLHEPELLFLDEPTIGLDVVSKERVREFLADLNARHNTTVLLTTHDLDDIERLCSRLLIIDHGHVIYDGGLDALRDKYGQERTLVVDLAETAAPITIAAAEVVKVDGPRQWLRFRRDDRDRRRAHRRGRGALSPARPHPRGAGHRGHRPPHLRRGNVTAAAPTAQRTSPRRPSGRSAELRRTPRRRRRPL